MDQSNAVSRDQVEEVVGQIEEGLNIAFDLLDEKDQNAFRAVSAEIFSPLKDSLASGAHDRAIESSLSPTRFSLESELLQGALEDLRTEHAHSIKIRSLNTDDPSDKAFEVIVDYLKEAQEKGALIVYLQDNEATAHGGPLEDFILTERGDALCAFNSLPAELKRDYVENDGMVAFDLNEEIVSDPNWRVVFLTSQEEPCGMIMMANRCDEKTRELLDEGLSEEEKIFNL